MRLEDVVNNHKDLSLSCITATKLLVLLKRAMHCKAICPETPLLIGDQPLMDVEVSNSNMGVVLRLQSRPLKEIMDSPANLIKTKGKNNEL